MATAQHIMRVKRTDKAGEHLLINITQSGSGRLDLKLVGTDQHHLFHQTVAERRINEFRAAQFSGKEQDWKTILKFALLQTRPEGALPDLLQGIECVASIGGHSANLTIRKNIDGITQKLGSILLEQDDEREEVAAFEWVDAAVAVSDDLRAQLYALQSSLVTHQEQVAQLNAQLDDLVKAKNEHDEELLQKFALLLNAKKLKIRDQQRLLSDAKVDVDSVQRQPDTYRNKKRRIEARIERDDHVQDADRGPGSAGVDTESGTDDEDEQRQETPQDSDVDAADDENVGASRTLGTMDVDEQEQVPPRRELPFSRKPIATQQQESQPDSNNKDGDDGETDDEL